MQPQNGREPRFTLHSIHDTHCTHHSIIPYHHIGNYWLTTLPIGTLGWQLHAHNLRVAGTAQRIAQHEVHVAGSSQGFFARG
jgi:hypothetical protein